MPRVNIRELDYTGAETTSYVENEALMPGIKIFGYETLLEDGTYDEDSILSLDGEYTSLDDFNAKVKQIFALLDSIDPVESGEEEAEWITNLRNIKNYFYKDYGFAMAYELLAQGLPVYYYGLYNVKVVTETSGDNDDLELADDFVNADIQTMYNEFVDRGKYDIKFVTVGWLGQLSDWSVLAGTAAIDCAAHRGDAVALLAAPKLAKDGTKLKTSSAIDKWIADNFKSGCELSCNSWRKGVTWTGSTEVRGTYGAMFNPNIKTSFTVDIDLTTESISYKFENRTFPGFLDYLLCYASVVQTTADWYAIAGSDRGQSPITISPVIGFGDVDTEVLQPREAAGEVDDSGNDVNYHHVAANLIRNVRPFGNVIWGNRTMQPLSKPNNGSSTAIQLTASSFLNIRSLCCDIKKTLYRAARQYTFEPNSDALWIKFKAQIKPILEQAKSDNGIRGYKLVKVDTNKKAVLAARIIITPIEAVEDFDLTVELTDTIEVNE